MAKDGHNGESKSVSSVPQRVQKKFNQMKEEISLELAEMGNLKPKHEPMTPNQRKKSESEKTY